ncbi:RND transporter, HAE1/HME family, permease protein [Teredinibacter turnerae T7901]|uniref:RND transporter, HAE1/HME family, permease protein n=1 Tax=Teredinibacter turnerae (strain ATCC 39867 / T7901) TaxID=377629 RepID=C5BN76_TERTT|nr:efflux RND transporter permease subunit [Teredinibacter turnerae]ACR12924.1 RND transporter, HAE1/HME family, permease protein [Teredinibacter turnerae T7901]
MSALIGWWVKNPIAANLLLFGVLAAGFIGFLRLDRELMPTIHTNVVEILVVWPGAAPEDLEEQVITRVERAIMDIDNIDRVSATAEESQALIVIEADPTVDMTRFLNQVKSRVAGIRSFPVEIEPPLVYESIFRNEVMRLVVFGELTERDLKSTAETIRSELLKLPGINLVELSGSRPDEFVIELSTAQMLKYGISFNEIALAIARSSINLSAGMVKTPSGGLQLRTENLANKKEDFLNIVVRNTELGGVIRVGDMATVVDGFVDELHLSIMQGKPAIQIKIMSAETTDVIDVSRRVNDWLAERKQRPQTKFKSGSAVNLATLDQGPVEIAVWWDSADIYKSRMTTIENSALSGLILVFAVLMLTLRFTVAVWVTVGIASSYMGTFALLPYMDVSINVLSTFAFLLVIGIIVDDAIVVGESIHTQTYKNAAAGADCVTRGVTLVAKPVVFSVATTMLAFLPWLFITGADAQVTRQIALVIIFALCFSLLDAFFILPAHLRKLKLISNGNVLHRFQERVRDGLVMLSHRHYRRCLEFVTLRPYLSISVFIALFVLCVGFLTSGLLQFSLAPEIESDQVTLVLNLESNVSDLQVNQIAEVVENSIDVLLNEKNGDPIQSPGVDQPTSGSAKIESWYLGLADNTLTALLKLPLIEARKISAEQLSQQWRSIIGHPPGVKKVQVFHRKNQEPALSYTISHPDPELISAAALAFKTMLAGYRDVYNIADTLDSNQQELSFSLKPAAYQLDLSISEITRQVRHAFYGEEVQRLVRNGEDVRVMVRLPRSERSSFSSLRNFRLQLADGREIPLSAVANFGYTSAIKRVERQNRQRTATVTAELYSADRRAIAQALNSGPIAAWQESYPGVTLGEVGEAEGEKRFFVEILSLYGIALFLMYALIAIAFQSYTLPLLVLVAIPFGFVGAVIGHLLFGVPMALFSYFGIGAAAGVVINDNLVLMHAVLQLRTAGESARTAMIEGAVSRFRPVLLTSVTTFVGLIPMISETSVQAQFLKPAVLSLAFGVLFALLVTLALVPALYVAGSSLRGRNRTSAHTAFDAQEVAIK